MKPSPKKKNPVALIKTESRQHLGKHPNNPSIMRRETHRNTVRETQNLGIHTAMSFRKSQETLTGVNANPNITNVTNNTHIEDEKDKDIESVVETVSPQKRDKERESVSPSRRNTLISSLPNLTEAAQSVNNTSQIKVIARFRPLNQVEVELSMKNMGSICSKFNSEETVTVTNNSNSPNTYTLDRIFDINTTQKELYDQVAKSTIDDVLKGYNGTIFTYGQSGSGKTFSMYGTDLYDDTNKGIIPRAIGEIFEFINDEANKEIKFELKFSMLEIYKENLHDLLNPETKPSDLKIKEHPRKGIYVANLSEEYISSEEEFLMMIENADDYRVKAETGLNKASSRSHLLFQLEIIQKLPDDTERRGMLNLVDLAGSEKVAKTHAVGETLEEAKKINLSLSTLGNVISALTGHKTEFVPYRDSKLTRILQDSLGGNYKTTLIVTCSPHIYNCEETISTLKFAQRAKKIKNKVKQNIKRSVEQLEAIIEALTKQVALSNEEVNRLKALCSANSISIPTKEDGGDNQGLNSYFNLNLHSMDNNTNNTSSANNNEKPSAGSNNEYLNIIKQKDDEIQSLHEKIETLQDENKSLQDKINRMSKETGYVHFYQILENLETFTKKNIDEVKNLKFHSDNLKIEELKYENGKIRKSYNILEEKYLKAIKEIEKKMKQDDKDGKMFKINFEEELNGSQLRFNKFFEDETFEGKCKKEISNSYKNIFDSAKLYLNTLLKDFMKKRDFFGSKFGAQPYTNQGEAPQTYLKNSYMKMSLLLVYYEKIVFDLMNRVLVDLSKYHIYQYSIIFITLSKIERLELKSNNKISIEQKCEGFNKSLIMYLEILEDMKEMREMKTKKEMEEKELRESEAGRGIVDMKDVQEVEGEVPEFMDKKESVDIEERKRNRFENNLNFLKSMNILKQETPQAKAGQNEPSNQNSANENCVENRKHNNFNIVKPVDKKKSNKLLNNLNLLFNRLVNAENFSNTFAGNNINNAVSVVETNPFALHIVKPEDGDRSREKSPDIIPTTSNSNNLLSLSIFNREKTFNKKPRGLNWLRESIVETTSKLYGINPNQGKEINNLSQQLKQVKKELSLYKTTVENLSSEIEGLKIKTLQTDTIISDFQIAQKKLFDLEVLNFTHIINIYKSLYDEEMKSKRKVIEELAKVVDEVYFKSSAGGVSNSNSKNKNCLSIPQASLRPQSMSIPSTSNSNIFTNYINTSGSRQHSTKSVKPVVYDYLEYKKEKILQSQADAHISDNTSVMKIAEAILHEGGTATKKLDYILFQIEDNFDNLRVEYGSGLHSTIPSKSPLCRNLKLSFIGDTHSDVESPEACD